MKFAVISDIHSNLAALQAVKKDIESQGVDKVYCLGDTIGYGPYPLECLNEVLILCSRVLMGNHEACVCNAEEQRDLNPIASAGIEYSRKQLTPDIIEGISRFPHVVPLPDIDFVLCHGAYTEPSLWKYMDRPQAVKEELKHTPHNVCLVGHTHVPFVYSSKHGLHKFLPDDLLLDPKEKHMINVGSVGQPRDGDCRASYGIFEVGNTVQFNLRRVFYNIGETSEAIIKAGLPKFLSERLFSGE